MSRIPPLGGPTRTEVTLHAVLKAVLLPRSFRRRFESDMDFAFRQELKRSTNQGVLGTWLFWNELAGDLALCGFRLRWYRMVEVVTEKPLTMNSTPSLTPPLEVSMSNANERLKSGDSTRFWVSMILATLLHAGLFVGFPTSTVAVEVPDRGPTEVIILNEDIPLPAPPEEIPRPALPVIVPDSKLTDPVTLPGFEDAWRRAPDLPPPPAEVVTGTDLPVAWTGPVQTYPRLLNRDEVERALERYYPTILRTAGIGGAPTVLFLIDVDGRVATRRLDTPSGHSALDEAALAVADEMRFAPAMNRDQPIAVWVSFPVRFQIR